MLRRVNFAGLRRQPLSSWFHETWKSVQRVTRTPTVTRGMRRAQARAGSGAPRLRGARSATLLAHQKKVKEIQNFGMQEQTSRRLLKDSSLRYAILLSQNGFLDLSTAENAPFKVAHGRHGSCVSRSMLAEITYQEA